MRTLIACIVLFMVATVVQAEMWDVLVDGSVWSHNVGEPHHNGYGNMTREQHAGFNEYEIEYVGVCPEGSHYAGKTWLGVVVLRSRYQRLYDVGVPVDPSEIYPSPDTLVPIIDGTGTVGTARLLVDADTMEVGAVVNTASPQHLWSVQLAAWRAEQEARAAAITELGLTQAQIDAIHAYFNADVDALFGALTVNQRKFLNVQRALVRALVRREIKEVR